MEPTLMPTKYTVEDAPAKTSQYTVEDAPAAQPPPPAPLARTFGNYAGELFGGIGHGLVNMGQGLYQPFTSPRATAQAVADQADIAQQEAWKDYNAKKNIVPKWMAATSGLLTGLENAPIVGGAVQKAETGGIASPESVGAAGELGTYAIAPEMVKKAPAVLKKGAQILSNTTPRISEELAADTAKKNAEVSTKNAEIQAKADAARKAQIEQHFEKRQQVRAQNEATQAAQSRKAALERGVEQLDPKFQDDLKATEKNVRAQANQKYDAVRKATAGETVHSASLAEAVKTAEEKIAGSSENLKIFRDILSKHPEGEPEAIEYQGAQIPKGHPLYEVLKEGSEAATKPATFNDLQGYYSELGDKLSTGNLPGDVYQAMKSLHDSVGGLMQQMAESKGVGNILSDAQNFYRQYMQAFRDSKSPLNKAMKATERGGAVKMLQGKDQSGIETLARYNPELAQRVNTIRGYQAEAKGIISKTAAPKPEPSLPSKTQPNLEEPKKIGLQDISDAKAKAIEDQVRFLRRRMSYLSGGYGAYQILHSIISGNLSGTVTGAALIAAPYVLSEALDSPKIVQALTKPTPADIAQIPTELRGSDLSTIVKAAEAKGIKVHPAVKALALHAAGEWTAAAGTTAKKK